MMNKPTPGQQMVLDRSNFEEIFDVLSELGYRIVGPTIREKAIVYDTLTSIADLPAGWTDEQEAGGYKIHLRNDGALFGYAVGPHSWKKYLHPPMLRLWQAKRNGKSFELDQEVENSKKIAIVGARSCELHAIAVQDKVFLSGSYVDQDYKARRENIFVIAVNCGKASSNCFCVSMKTGPKATFGFDLLLTEILEDNRHYFIVEAGTEPGGELLAQVKLRQAEESEKKEAQEVVNQTALSMKKTLDTADIKELLYRNPDHPRWDEVANRCLTCGNCTMVCPTCFCTTVEDVTDLAGENAERWRKWDSCFTADFSFIHGGSVRASAKSRYRQWMTHKLAAWIDQFGTSGCVGCGRCITWCPVGIDITKELQAIRDTDGLRSPEVESDAKS